MPLNLGHAYVKCDWRCIFDRWFPTGNCTFISGASFTLSATPKSLNRSIFHRTLDYDVDSRWGGKVPDASVSSPKSCEYVPPTRSTIATLTTAVKYSIPPYRCCRNLFNGFCSLHFVSPHRPQAVLSPLPTS
jgi:hypothetical protein